jgi:hypothetical protein
MRADPDDIEHLPEISNLSRSVQRELIAASREQTVSSAKWWLLFVVAIVATLSTPFFVNLLLPRLSGLLSILPMFAVALGMGAWIMYVKRGLQREWIAGELVKMDLRPLQCLICGYDLRGTPAKSTSCPECGAAIAPLQK